MLNFTREEFEKIVEEGTLFGLYEGIPHEMDEERVQRAEAKGRKKML